MSLKLVHGRGLLVCLRRAEPVTVTPNDRDNPPDNGKRSALLDGRVHCAVGLMLAHRASLSSHGLESFSVALLSPF